MQPINNRIIALVDCNSFYVPCERLFRPVILQKVSAGFPSPATDYVQDEIDLNSELIKNPPATFLIRVQGNSMTEHKITSGDLLVVDRSLNLKNDCIAIINFNNELVVKNIIKENNNFYIKNKAEKILISENSDVNVWGIVTYIIHAAH